MRLRSEAANECRRDSNGPSTNWEKDETHMMKQTSLKVMGLGLSKCVNREADKESPLRCK